MKCLSRGFVLAVGYQRLGCYRPGNCLTRLLSIRAKCLPFSGVGFMSSCNSLGICESRFRRKDQVIY